MIAKINTTKRSAVPDLPFYIPLFNHAVRAFLRIGVPMGYVGLLTVKGRKTGSLRRNPVGLFRYNRKRYLFSTFGDVNWVRNLRSAREASVKRGFRSRRVVPVELPLSEAVEVLKGAIAPAFLGLGARSSLLIFPLNQTRRRVCLLKKPSATRSSNCAKLSKRLGDCQHEQTCAPSVGR